MSKMEAALIKFSGFKETRHRNRKDYLVALALEVMKSPNDWDDLNTEAATWVNMVLNNRKRKMDIPDFPDVEDTDEAKVSNGSPESESGNHQAAETGADEVEFESGDESKGTDAFTAEATVPYPEPAKPKKKRKPRIDLNGNFNRYGVPEGSRYDQACKFFEKGGTQRQCEEAIGSTKYNFLKRLATEGHHVIKDEKGFIRLVHKDDPV